MAIEVIQITILVTVLVLNFHSLNLSGMFPIPILHSPHRFSIIMKLIGPRQGNDDASHAVCLSNSLEFPTSALASIIWMVVVADSDTSASIKFT